MLLYSVRSLFGGLANSVYSSFFWSQYVISFWGSILGSVLCPATHRIHPVHI